MRNRLFTLSQESDDLEDDDKVVTPAEISEDAVELQGQEQQLDSADQEAAQALEAVRSLECLCETLSQTSYITPEVSAVTEVALESIYQSIGVTRPRSVTFEAEETSSESRIARIKEQIKRILMAIAEAFRRAMDWVNDYFLQLTGAAARLEKYAIAKLRELRSLRNNRINDAELNNRSLVKRLYTEKNDLPATMLMVQELVTDASAAALGDHVKVLNRAIEDFVEGKDISKLVESIPEIFKKAYSGIFPLSGSQVPIQIEESYNPKGTTLYSTKWLVGDYLAMIVIPDDIDTISKLAFYIRSNPDLDPGPKMKYAQPDEIEQLLKQVIAICSVVRAFEKNRKGLEAFQGTLTKAVKKLSSTEGDFSDQDRQFLKSLSAVAPMIAKGIHQRVFGYAINTSRSVVQYTDLCMKNLEVRPAT
jgi:hypothetical protein